MFEIYISLIWQFIKTKVKLPEAQKTLGRLAYYLPKTFKLFDFLIIFIMSVSD